MCAEHSKDPKPDDNEVCGCPLNPETFYEMDLNTIATCRTAKKLCRKHLLWEKMYRAEIDLKVSFFLVRPRPQSGQLSTSYLAYSGFDQIGSKSRREKEIRKWYQ